MIQGMQVIQQLQEKHFREIQDWRSELGNDVRVKLTRLDKHIIFLADGLSK